MGVEKSKSRLSELIARACRLPRDVAGKVGNLSDSVSKERLRALQPNHHIPYKFLVLAILVLPYLPAMLTLTYAIPPQINVTYGTDVNSESYCAVTNYSEPGVTHAVLLNSTPFSFSDEWDANWHPYFRDYDINSYGWNDSDGYHFTSLRNDYTTIWIQRRMQVPIANYSRLTMSAEFEGISGTAGIYFEAFAGDDARAVEEDLVLPGNITTVNVSAPLSQARASSDSWLCMITFRLQIGFSDVGLTDTNHVVLKSIVIDATFTGKMNCVQLDFKSTDNVSLFENPYMKYADYSPRLALLQNNNSETISTYYSTRMNDELYLPPGTYEGMAYWNFRYQEEPDPTNNSLWAPNVNFTVSEDTTLKVNVGLFAKRINLEINPSFITRHFSVYFLNDYQYSESADISGSTLYSRIPTYLYIPGEIESLTIYLATWSSMEPFEGYSWASNQQFVINQELNINSTNLSKNLLFKVNLPLISLGGMLLGLGEIVLISVVFLLIVGFLVSLRRSLRYANLRHRLYDSRIVPLLMLSASIVVPWGVRFGQVSTPGYDSVSWISWHSCQFMIRWTSNTPVQLLVSTADWWYASWAFTFLFFIPLSYGFLSLASVESEKFNKTFALALLLPCLIALSGFNYAALNLETISLGPILVLAAFPVWLLRIGLRKLGFMT